MFREENDFDSFFSFSISLRRCNQSIVIQSNEIKTIGIILRVV